METRQLGSTGPAVSALGLGCMGMSNAYGAADRSESLAAISHTDRFHPTARWSDRAEGGRSVSEQSSVWVWRFRRGFFGLEA